MPVDDGDDLVVLRFLRRNAASGQATASALAGKDVLRIASRSIESTDCRRFTDIRTAFAASWASNKASICPPENRPGRNPTAHIGPAHLPLQGAALRTWRLANLLPRCNTLKWRGHGPMSDVPRRPIAPAGTRLRMRHVPGPSPSRRMRITCSDCAASPRRSSAPPTTARSSTSQARVTQINALEPEIAALSDDELRARTAEFQDAARRRQDASTTCCPGLRHGARGGQAHARPAPFRRAADRRHGAARRQDRRDEDRRRQDAGRHAAGLSQRAGRQGRACRHRQRLPRQARRRMDGPGLRLPGPDRRRASSTASTTRSAATPTPATSPTAPTTNSASTTCATT